MPCNRPAITPLRMPSHLQSQAHASHSPITASFPPACSIKELSAATALQVDENTSQHTGCVLSPLLSFPVYPAWISCPPLGSFLFVLPSFLLISMAQGKLFYLQKPLPRAIKMECCVLSQLVVTPSLITNFEWPGIPDFYWTYLKSLF